VGCLGLQRPDFALTILVVLRPEGFVPTQPPPRCCATSRTAGRGPTPQGRSRTPSACTNEKDPATIGGVFLVRAPGGI
jgi:hypothetical protein